MRDAYLYFPPPGYRGVHDTYFGILPLRDGILEGWSMTYPDTLPCLFFLPGCQSVSHPWGRAGGPRRSPERGGGLVSLVAVPGGEQLPNFTCSCRDQMVLCSHRTLSREVGLSQFLSFSDCVELLLPCSWLSWTFP